MKSFFTCLLAVLLCLLAACETTGAQNPGASTSDKQTRAIRALGFTDIRVGAGNSSPWMECADSDSYLNSKSFTARTKEGELVEGVVCCGWIKGCTVRF